MPPHRYNRTAFHAASQTSGPLVDLYLRLVTLELALKDSAPWPADHDLPTMLASIHEAALGQQLASELTKLHCTDKTGAASKVNKKRYPDMRYLRHSNDFPQGSTDAELGNVMALVNQIISRLPARGVAFP